MTIKVVIASRNEHKIDEMRRILNEAGLSLDLVGIREFPDLPDVDETGTTFAENALLKAREICAFTGIPAIADDSGLCVDALGGMPGIFSARWAGTHGNDLANLQLLLAQISHVAPDRRTASFRCAAAIVMPSGAEEVVEGIMRGRIIDTPRGTNGFGYDPIFIAEGYSITTAEMDSASKDAISHRGLAIAALAPTLAQLPS